MSTIKDIMELSNWLTAELERASSKRGRKAAHVLHRAAVLVSACRALDYLFRKIVNDIQDFKPDWPEYKRATLIEEIRMVAFQDTLLDELQLSVGYLEEESRRPSMGSWLSVDRKGELIRELVEHGRRVLELLGETDMTPWQSAKELSDLLNGVAHARDPQSVEQTISLCRKCLEKLDRASLREANAMLGKLEQIVVQQYSISGLPRTSRDDRAPQEEERV
jgi:hypothetical protein